MKTPEEIGMQISQECFDTGYSVLIMTVARAIEKERALQQVTEDEIAHGMMEYTHNEQPDMGEWAAFKAGAQWCLKKLKGEL